MSDDRLRKRIAEGYHEHVDPGRVFRDRKDLTYLLRRCKDWSEEKADKEWEHDVEIINREEHERMVKADLSRKAEAERQDKEYKKVFMETMELLDGDDLISWDHVFIDPLYPNDKLPASKLIGNGSYYPNKQKMRNEIISRWNGNGYDYGYGSKRVHVKFRIKEVGE